jgi:hypothetical protein
MRRDARGYVGRKVAQSRHGGVAGDFRKTHVTRLALAVLAIAAAALHIAPALAAPAQAAAHGDNGLRGAGKGRPPKVLGTHAKEEAEEPQLLEAPEGSSATSLAKELGSSGTIDPLSGLGIRNPVCDQPAQIRSQATRTSCEVTGTPETTYPTSDYGFDVFIPTGVTHPIGDFTAAFVTILNGIWLGLLFVLKLTLTLLGLAFGLNPFANGPTMARISAAVTSIYTEVTDPWLSALVVCAGVALAWRGLIRRDVAGSLAGTIASIALLLCGLWVVHAPRETVGRIADFSDQVALEVIAAPQSGSLGRPVGTYAEAMTHVWSRLVEVPFAGLDFSDVNWALSPPPEEAVKKANEAFCGDNGSLTLLAQLAHLGISTAKEQCARFAEERYGKPHRVIDLYLRSSPNSAARSALWNYFDNDDQYKPKVAAQGGDGVITRLSMLALFALGLLGAMLLLAWLAIRLFTQAAIAFVLLLAAPFALFFPLLGDWGRRAFRRWGLTLLGAVAAKVIYAAFLSVVLFGIVILGSVDGSGGSATGFLLAAAFSWAVFLKRGDLIGWISVGDHEHLAGVGIGGLAALGLATRLGRSPVRRVRTVVAAAPRHSRERSRLSVEATRQTARDSLDCSARALGEERLRDARRTVAAYEEARRPRQPGERSTQGPASARSGLASRAERNAPAAQRAGSTAPATAAQSSRQPTPTPGPERYRAAKELVARAERNSDRGGDRWTRKDVARFAREDRELLRGSTDPADHAHRAGYERARFEALKGPDRERAEARIEKARQRDLQRLEVTTKSERPSATERPKLLAERGRQLVGGEGPERRAHLRTLRRQRRSTDHLIPRRNLSRGA